MSIDDRIRRLAAIVLTMGTLAGFAGACSTGGSSSSQLTPKVVNRYVLTKQATASLTRLFQLIHAADGTVQLLVAQPPGTPSSRSLLFGARLGWNNIGQGLNTLTQNQAAIVPQIGAAVGQYKLVVTAWTNALDELTRHPAKNRRALMDALADPRKQELDARSLLTAAAAGLAKETCSLELAHHELATAGDTATACGTARQLSAQPPTT